MSAVWQFWCGPRPVWIDSCLRLMAAVHRSARTEYHLLGAEDLKAYGLEEYWSRLDPAQLSDLMRFAVLERYGGTYVDADFAPFRALDTEALLGSSKVAVSGGSSDETATKGALEPNFIAIRSAGCPLMTQTRREQFNRLEVYGRRWGHIASPAFMAALLRSSIRPRILNWRTFALISHTEQEKYAKPGDYRILSWLNRMYGCMFWNSGMRGFAGAMTLSSILTSKSLMAQTLRACACNAVTNYGATDAVITALSRAASSDERELTWS